MTDIELYEPRIKSAIGSYSCRHVLMLFKDWNRHVFTVKEALACWIYDEFRDRLGLHDRNMFMPWFTDICALARRNELNGNPDRLIFLRAQAEEWAIREAVAILEGRTERFSLSAEPVLSRWKRLLQYARAVWECGSDSRDEWYKIGMDIKEEK